MLILIFDFSLLFGPRVLVLQFLLNTLLCFSVNIFWQCALRLVCSVCVLNWVCKSMITPLLEANRDKLPLFSSPLSFQRGQKKLYNLLKKKRTLAFSFLLDSLLDLPNVLEGEGWSRAWDWRHWGICALRDLQNCASARSDR